jgi:hypothetical protein
MLNRFNVVPTSPYCKAFRAEPSQSQASGEKTMKAAHIVPESSRL